jgi:hypothetical protein
MKRHHALLPETVGMMALQRSIPTKQSLCCAMRAIASLPAWPAIALDTRYRKVVCCAWG